MTKEFQERVKREMVVDTEKYRYAMFNHSDRATIERIELDKLGTTEVFGGWEVVREYK